MKQNQIIEREYSLCSPPKVNASRHSIPVPRISRLRFAITLMLLLFTFQKANAQPNEISYLFHDWDLKNYASDALLTSTNDDHVVAGTIFPAAGDYDNKIHFMYFSDPTMAPTIMPISRVFNDPDYDERAVGIHFLSSTDIVIVASRRDYQNLIGVDGIEVVRVNNLGSLQYAKSITGNTSSYDNIYPLGTLVDHNYLYICGYVTANGTTNYPNFPEFTSDRKAFVLKYDLTTDAVVAAKTWEYTFSPSATLTYDYDMAMRMKMFNAGLFIVGSCNVVHPDQASNDHFVGGTLSILLDPTTFVDIYNKPFCDENLLSSSGDAEHGFDVIENTWSGGGFFVFSNTFNTQSGIDGYDPIPKWFSATGLNSFLDPLNSLVSTYQDRVYFNNFDYAWGVNTVESQNSPANADAIIISGYQNNRACSNGTDPTTQDNINPFLAEFDLSIGSSSINAAYTNWSTIKSSQGTGTFSWGNSFMKLGGGLSNTVWGPITTTRNLPRTDIVAYGPVWNAGNNKENLKYIRTDALGALTSCPYQVCSTSVTYTETDNSDGIVYDPLIEEQDYSTQVNDITLQEANFVPDATPDCNGASFYRPTPNTAAIIPTKTMLYPNPAKDWITVKLASEISHDASINIELRDITSRRIGVLYQGRADALTDARLSLPELAAGVYQVTIHSDRLLLYTQPLSIQ